MARSGTKEVGAPTPTSRSMARSIGALCAAGSALAIVRAALAGDAAGAGQQAALAGGAAVLALGVILTLGAGDRLAPRWFHLVLAGVQVAITVAYAAGGDPSSDVRLFYLWTAPVACTFFLPRHAIDHLALVGALLAGALVVQQAPVGTALSVWTMTFGALAAVGAFVGGVASAVRRREEALDHAAHHDTLTGLGNRRAFGRHGTDVLSRREAEGGAAVLFLADLDRFKTLNDTQGHVVGDEVLVAIARELKRLAPFGATVARLGGDEFAILVEDPGGYLDVQLVADDLAQAWQRPIPTRDRGQVHTSSCMGIARSSPGDTPSSLLRDAEVAMLRAKKSGPGSISVFRPEQRADEQRRYAVEQGLHGAAAHDEFHLVFQPVVEISTGRLRAAETLLRWTSPVLGDVSPAEFIPVAEDNGLVVPIGTWVMEHAVAQLGAWLAAGIVPPDFHLSINVSALQVDDTLPGRIAALLSQHGVDPEMIMIELTETVLISANAETNESLTALREMGLLLVLDDFGTGFSSLSHLQRAKFDAVKIDRSFVRGVVDAGTDRSIVTAILALAEALDIDVVAEGVESRDQADALRGLGCRWAQGYLYDRPLAPEVLAERMSRPVLRSVTAPPMTTQSGASDPLADPIAATQ